MNIRVEEELRFKNAAHINNHLNYLFRCDKAQRWTNYITKDNFAIYSESDINIGKIMYFNKTLNELSAIKQKIKEKIEIEQDYINRGRMLRIELIDEANRFREEDINFGKMLYEAMVVAEGIKPICVIGHQDQEDYYLHWHMLYINDTKEDFGKLLVSGQAKRSSCLDSN